MRKLSILLASIVVVACSLGNKNGSKADDNLYIIETNYGNMTIRLYDETPKHRDNFKKLVDSTFYDGLLFHRVINGFMIQGGDPNSKGAMPGVQLGSGSPGYTLPAEIIDTLIHKKGAIAAARLGDNMNPEMRSSGSQFYIVHGSKVEPMMLDKMEQRINIVKRQALTRAIFNDSTYADWKEMYLKGRQTNNMELIKYYGTKFDSIINDSTAKNPFKYTAQARAVYDSIGGTPGLDGQYTVFGEVIEGFNVLDSIAAVEVNKRIGDRPKMNVTMTIKKL